MTATPPAEGLADDISKVTFQVAGGPPTTWRLSDESYQAVRRIIDYAEQAAARASALEAELAELKKPVGDEEADWLVWWLRSRKRHKQASVLTRLLRERDAAREGAQAWCIKANAAETERDKLKAAVRVNGVLWDRMEAVIDAAQEEWRCEQAVRTATETWQITATETALDNARDVLFKAIAALAAAEGKP